MCGLEPIDWMMLPTAPMGAYLVLLGAGYFTMFTAAGGQTIGKMAARIRVVGEECEPVDFGHAALRTVGYFASVLPFCLGFVPALGGRRALHDRLAETRVVRA
jgi:uncharacterized RDD family membrane protein YckC